MDNPEKNTQLFLYLVGTYEMTAMMAMGKIKNPVTDKVELDLDQARFAIDVLDMLKEKTKGNLAEYEMKFLDNLIGQLKLNYLTESQKKSSSAENANDKPEETK